MAFSVIGAVVLGGTLAWNQRSLVSSEDSTVGSLSTTATYTEDNDLIGPSGQTVAVGTIDLENTGDFNIKLLNGDVIIRSVDVGHPSCNITNFAGFVIDQTGGNVIAPGDTVNDAARVDMNVGVSAPSDCIGAIITYDIFLTVKTEPGA